jgi:hypothetical protein
MIFKIIAFIAAAIPIFLFVRSIFFRRTTRINEGLREFKKQANLAVDISVPNCVCCSLRRRQVSLDVVVVTLNASAPPEDGMVQKIDLQHMSARRLGAAW